MSDSVHCSKSKPCPQYTRLLRVMAAYLGALLVLAAAVVSLLVLSPKDTPSDQKPAPPSSASADPSPSSPPSTPTPDLTDGGCNIFDPECSPNGGTGGVGPEE